MPVEIMHPFSVSRNGGISATADPDKQINQHVNTLLSTEPGERRVQFDYGLPTRSLLFENGPNLLAMGLTEQVRSKMAVYEPGVLIQRLDAEPSPEGSGLAEVRLDYTRRESPLSPSGIARNTNVAVINVGGTVDEVVRG